MNFEKRKLDSFARIDSILTLVSVRVRGCWGQGSLRLCASDESPTGTGAHQTCPLCTVGKHFVPLSYFDPGRRPRCSKALAQGRDFWLPVILATEQAVDDNFKDRQTQRERTLKVSFVGRDVRLICAHPVYRSYSQGGVGCKLRALLAA